MKKNSSSKRLLIIDDEKNMRHMLSALLKNNDYIPDTASDGLQGLEMLKVSLENEDIYDFILCDISMPKMDGMEFLKSAGDLIMGTTVIMMSAFGTIDTAVEAMKLGAYDYISKPFRTDEVLLALKKAQERERLKRENLRLKERISTIEANYNNFGNMSAKSRSMEAVFKLGNKASQYDTTVLITGESGTGKELVAKGIHFNGKRSKMPLVTVNCGGIPENLLESEFFGYKKGAFTGADRDKNGLFEEADNGTFFLDEIGELPVSLQVKLLRVLQENEIRMIGDTKTKKINVRIIAATAKNLEEEVKNGNFREDLFYRLNILPVTIPPLRKRTEDIPLLSMLFLEKFNRIFEKKVEGIARESMLILLKHKWPGNVRELENAMERAVLMSEEKYLMPVDFPPEIIPVDKAEEAGDLFHGFSLKKAQKIIEKKLITKALKNTGGNRTKASRLLEISHPSLLSKIKTYDISL